MYRCAAAVLCALLVVAGAEGKKAAKKKKPTLAQQAKKMVKDLPAKEAGEEHLSFSDTTEDPDKIKCPLCKALMEEVAKEMARQRPIYDTEAELRKKLKSELRADEIVEAATVTLATKYKFMAGSPADPEERGFGDAGSYIPLDVLFSTLEAGGAKLASELAATRQQIGDPEKHYSPRTALAASRILEDAEERLYPLIFNDFQDAQVLQARMCAPLCPALQKKLNEKWKEAEKKAKKAREEKKKAADAKEKADEAASYQEL
eukprot:TRINITY_DN3280_c1_g2_i2.p1 TRINITY_DN3280_c1_g2~~TRINITY_DN3280_c1_g2_i2.p1  ORF type:complete len:261 (+),score=128.47 TRINITY_DN3280_c1_g2_i2:82-864(+)